VEDALPSAAAIELLHTAFLVHDDVEDDSDLRRGEPTLHRQYGRALAINAGDGLAVLALGALRDNESRLGRRLTGRIWSEFDFMARQTVDGQALELGWQREGRTDLTADDYLDLIMKKTCWYTTVLPLRVGALIGTKGTVDLKPMLRFGFFLGAAFQIRDDILNLTGSPAVYGKEPLGDLREGKRTLMLAHLLAAADPPDRARIVRYLALQPAERSAAVISQIFAMMQDHGSVAFADEFARGIARSAAVAFEEAFAGAPDSPARRFVGDLIPYMVERDR
jgi:geranylgeranyl diphosphate synthase type II